MLLLLLQFLDLNTSETYFIAVVLNQDMPFRRLAEVLPYFVFALGYQLFKCRRTAIVLQHFNPVQVMYYMVVGQYYHPAGIPLAWLMNEPLLLVGLNKVI